MTDPGDASGERVPEPVAHGLLVQAPVPPLDEDGIVVTTVGTVAFALAAIVLTLMNRRLTAAGDGWWLWVAIAGVVLGLIGLAYCRRRRRVS